MYDMINNCMKLLVQKSSFFFSSKYTNLFIMLNSKQNNLLFFNSMSLIIIYKNKLLFNLKLKKPKTIFSDCLGLFY
jgi:hypothetical protein